MTAKLEKKMMIVTSLCDSSGRLSPWSTFSLLMDIATEHAAALKLGANDLGNDGLFWLASRTKVQFFSRPALEEIVTAVTFPEKPKGVRANRDYLIKRGDETLIRAKTEWAVLDVNENKIIRTDRIYPEGFEFEKESVFSSSFSRVKDDFSEDVFASYTIRSTDIDLGHHMNNAIYPRVIASLFSEEEIMRHEIKEADIRYVSACFEGETLLFQKRLADDGALEIRGFVQKENDERTVVLARLTFEKKEED